MLNINRATLLGRLTNDPTIKKVPSGKTLATFGIATNRVALDPKTKERHEVADFHNVVAWGKLAELAEKYMSKGQPVYLEGRLQNRTWDSETKGKQSKTEVIVENIIFLGGKNTASAQTEDDIVMEEIPFDDK